MRSDPEVSSLTNRYPDEDYNDLAPWKFAEIPAVMGWDDWYTATAIPCRPPVN
jgi:TPP-dependent 2-oxoacid decarboxylase